MLEISPGSPVVRRVEKAGGRADEVGCKLLAESRKSESLRRFLGQDLHCHQHPKQSPERRFVCLAIRGQIGGGSRAGSEQLGYAELRGDPQ